MIHFSLSILDITITFKNYDTTGSDNWEEANYFSRIMALVCYELLKNSSSVSHFGVEKYKDIEGAAQLIKNVEEKSRLISRYYSENSKFLKEIRHFLIGHRKGTGTEQAIKTREISNSKIMVIGDATVRLVAQLLSEQMKLMNFIIRIPLDKLS